MAISWSSWDYSGGNGMRIGFETSVSSVSNGSSSVTLTVKVYTGNQYNYQDNGQTIIYGGDKSGTVTYNNTQSSGTTTLRDTFTLTHSYSGSSYGSSPGKWNFSARIGYSYNDSHPSKSMSVTIPARPIAAPAAPSNIVASRVSDSQGRVTWSRNATAGRPYSSIDIQREDENGGWPSSAKLSGSATSHVSSISTNHYYRWRARARNNAGVSAWVTSDGIRTSPAAPSNFKAAAQSGGASIRLTWTINKAYAAGGEEIERQVNGGSWVHLVDINDTGVYVDNAPGAGTNRYRIRESVESQGQQLYSSWTLSNIVSTIVPPNAPTNLSPNAGYFDASKPIPVSWQHNPGGDGAEQTGWEIRFNDGSGNVWFPGGGDYMHSGTEGGVLPGGTFTNGKTVQWIVHTWGAHADSGPYSAVATIYTSAPPTIAVTGPTGVVDQLPAVVTWTYAHLDRPQGAWSVQVTEVDGGVVFTRSGTGSTTSVTIPAELLADEAAYTLRVTSSSSVGIAATPATGSFSVDLPVPADVTLVPGYDPESGVVIVSLEALPVGADQAAVDTVSVQRRIGDGPWITIHRDVAVPEGETVDLRDTTPSLAAPHEYRLVIWSVAPSTKTTDPVELVTAGHGRGAGQTMWGFLSYGPGFDTILRGAGDPALTETRGRVRATQPVQGRRKPILLIGEQRSRTKQVGLSLHWDGLPGGIGDSSTDLEYLTAGEEAETVLFRDWTGTRIFGLLSDVQVTQPHPYGADVTFSITETDHVEGV